jgi:hypothetical protein
VSLDAIWQTRKTPTLTAFPNQARKAAVCGLSLKMGVYTMAVLGGTEAFAGATGDATLTDGDAGTEFVINLT